ncbi:MAG: hypothetical protein WAN66_15385 [Limnoraphis robusta]|uniref:GIY-YIG domain-containing protein n=1 Tax=Limnoraphis robusta CCNP1315 TaxID=3110306 RepID=A0ABU5TYW2_9CYAN|nr:hypothetical protein [Limnoraphis robusta]MEA5501333.1 hypothetical protein [Limnoraphis robusta BA-68 BA1]MEA5520134.1 hypothetical protein [Limnoraphis robusta CCNP1315]MEA5543896.1 hypothetical protein [Limnoraphis robusta CCNP1324]
MPLSNELFQWLDKGWYEPEISSIKTDLHKLPNLPGIYAVYIPNQPILYLYIGMTTETIYKRWTGYKQGHHQYEDLILLEEQGVSFSLKCWVFPPESLLDLNKKDYGKSLKDYGKSLKDILSIIEKQLIYNLSPLLNKQHNNNPNVEYDDWALWIINYLEKQSTRKPIDLYRLDVEIYNVPKKPGIYIINSGSNISKSTVIYAGYAENINESLSKNRDGIVQQINKNIQILDNPPFIYYIGMPENTDIKILERIAKAINMLSSKLDRR